METPELIARATAGDHDAFRELVDVHSHELQVHCYRILGSVQDAEDALQETLVSVWRNLGGFRQQSSLRTWLYQIATNRCLSMLRADSRRPQRTTPLPDLALPEPNGVSDAPPWLEPYPDVLLDNLVDHAPGPEARYETAEAISLAFITALQLLPPRQRAVLVLRDVLGYRAAEVASMLDATQESVQSALKRARATVGRHLADSGGSSTSRQPGTAAEGHLVAQLTDALERSDVQALVALFAEDVRVSMPPAMLEYRGIDLAQRFFAAVTLRPDRSYRVVPTRANGAPAFGMYLADPHAGVFRAYALLVVTIADDRVGAVTGFDASVLPRFGLPRTLPGADRPAAARPTSQPGRAPASASGMMLVWSTTRRSTSAPLRTTCPGGRPTRPILRTFLPPNWISTEPATSWTSGADPARWASSLPACSITSR